MAKKNYKQIAKFILDNDDKRGSYCEGDVDLCKFVSEEMGIELTLKEAGIVRSLWDNMVNAGFYTFRQIKEAVNSLTEEQLDMTAMIYDSDAQESFAISECFLVSELPEKHRDEVELEDNQPLFVVGPVTGLDLEDDE